MKPLPQMSQSRVKLYRKLLQKKYRTIERKFIIEGVHMVGEALASEWKIEAIAMTKEFYEKAGAERIGRRAEGKKISVFEISQRQLGELSGTVSSQGVIGILSTKNQILADFWSSVPARCCVVALEDVSDPGNVGTIIRTCDWFGLF